MDRHGGGRRTHAEADGIFDSKKRNNKPRLKILSGGESLSASGSVAPSGIIESEQEINNAPESDYDSDASTVFVGEFRRPPRWCRGAFAEPIRLPKTRRTEEEGSAPDEHEEVIRMRLLIDGDGTGDDRRINALLKSFVKWSTGPEVDQITHERMLSQLAQCEYAQKKSHFVSMMSDDELKNYDAMSKQIDVEIKEAIKDIEETKNELQEAKRIRKNRIEYDVLAKVINEQPDRQETNKKLATLREELGGLKEKSEQLEHKLAMRRKQFHVLISSIHALQGMLDESDEEIMDVSLENYEDADTPMSTKTAD